jgi:hypothetical protein
MSYIEEVQRREVVAADAARETANRAAFSTICDHWPLADKIGNYRVLVEWCGGEITVAKFQAFVAAGDNHADGVAYGLDWSGTRDRLLAEIANELDPNGARLTQADLNTLFQRRVKGESVRIDQIVLGKSRQIDNEIGKMKFWSKAQLRAKLAELRYKREVRAKSAADLHADVAAHRRSQHADNPWHPYDRMPVEITKEVYRAASTQQILIWNRRFGQEQVRARLNNLA